VGIYTMVIASIIGLTAGMAIGYFTGFKSNNWRFWAIMVPVGIVVALVLS